MMVWVATIAFCTAFASSAKAACPSSFRPGISKAARSDRPSAGLQAHPGLPASEGPNKGSDRDVSIVGLWKIAFLQDGQVVDEGFDAWHGDGTETLNDSVPPSTGNVCLGVWVKTGKRTYKLKHLSWNYDGTGATPAIGVVVIREEVTLDRHGNAYQGTVTIEVFDLQEHLLFQYGGEVTGRRITVD
jgi:hypothetical protein